jgi:hypothetical protein
MEILQPNILKAVAVVLCSFLLLECSGPKGRTGKPAGGKDTLSTADSISSSSIRQKGIVLTYEQQQGKILFTKYCAICHGDLGKGDGFNAYNLDPKPRDFTDSRAMAGIDDALMRATITDGGKGVNKSPLMPAWGGRIGSLEMEYVIAYVKVLEEQH